MPPKKKEPEVVDSSGQPLSRIAQVLANETLAQLKKKWGSNAVQLASDERVREKHLVPSGILKLDWALGGGWQAGRIHTLYGMKSTAKTTIILNSIAQAQKICALCFTSKDAEGNCKCKSFRDHVCVFIDVEGTWDDKWAKCAKVNTDSLLYIRPEYAEQSLDILESLLRGGDVDLIAMDSLAFLTPLKEIEEDHSKDLMGAQPRLLGRGIRKLVAALTHVKNEKGRLPTIFFTNQVRMKIGVLFGDPSTVSGGLAPQFAATSEIKTWAGKYHMDEVTGKPMYVDINFRVEKNKAAAPKMEGDFRLILSDTETKHMGDIYEESVILELGEKFGLIEGSGNSWTCLGEKFHGKSLIERRLLTDPDFKATVRASLVKVLMAI